MAETSSSGGGGDFVGKVLEQIPGAGKWTAAQATAATVAYSGAAISDAYWSFVPHMDATHAGGVTALAAVGLTAIAQGAAVFQRRRTLRKRVLKDPESFMRILLDSKRDDLAGELNTLLTQFQAGFVSKRQLGIRLVEIQRDLTERPNQDDEPEGSKDDTKSASVA